MSQNFYEINIKKKIFSLISRNYENIFKKQIDLSMKIAKKRENSLKRLFFNYLKLYLDYEKDKIYLIKNKIEELIKVKSFIFKNKNLEIKKYIYY